MVSLSAVPLKAALPMLRTVEGGVGKIPRRYKRHWNKNGVAAQVIAKFRKKTDGKYRIYIPLKGPAVRNVKPLASVVATLNKLGFRIENYVAGTAVKVNGDDGRVFNIGKLLNKYTSVKNMFDSDPQRASQSGYMVVISCHPYDILGMSTGRHWDMTSCMRLATKKNGDNAGVNAGLMLNDIEQGTLVAYVVENSAPHEKELKALQKTKQRDEETVAKIGKLSARVHKAKNIESPISRLLIKPFYSEDGDVAYRIELAAYGNNVPGFKETVKKWLAKVNENVNLSKEYKLGEGLYNDGIGDTFASRSFYSFRTQAARESYVSNDVTLMHDRVRLVCENRNWLWTIMEADLDYRADESTLSNFIVEVKEADPKFPNSYFVHVLDKIVPEEYLDDIVQGMVVNGNKTIREVLAKSKRAQRFLKRKLAYKPDDWMRVSRDDLRMHAIAYDSRWLNEFVGKHGTPPKTIVKRVLQGDLSPDLSVLDQSLAPVKSFVDSLSFAVSVLHGMRTATQHGREHIDDLYGKGYHVDDLKYTPENAALLNNIGVLMLSSFIDDNTAIVKKLLQLDTKYIEVLAAQSALANLPRDSIYLPQLEKCKEKFPADTTVVVSSLISSHLGNNADQRFTKAMNDFVEWFENVGDFKNKKFVGELLRIAVDKYKARDEYWRRMYAYEKQCEDAYREQTGKEPTEDRRVFMLFKHDMFVKNGWDKEYPPR